MSFRGYHGLTVWNRAVDLVEMTYHLTNDLNSEAAPEILADMRRNALAIPSNLAAGYQTSSTEEYLRYIHAAQVTLATLESSVTTLHRLQWAEESEIDSIQALMTHLDHLLGCLERYLTGQESSARAR